MKLRRNKLVPLVLEERPGIASGASWSGGIRQEIGPVIERLESIRQDWLQSTLEVGLGRTCLDLPENLLREYSLHRTASRLGEIFAWANRFQSQTDRVVFVGSADSHRIIRTFKQACCDPFWNELTRGERGSKPRVYFVGDSLDNDSLQGHLQMLSSERPANRGESFGWGTVVLTGYEQEQSVIVAEKHLRQHLQRSGNEVLFYECHARVCEDSPSPCFVPSALLPFSPQGMLPAAILGINIMELLAGASWTSKLFASAASTQNPILQWVAWNHVAESRRVALWNPSLSAGMHWLVHLERSLSKGGMSPSGPCAILDPLSDQLSPDELACCNHIWVEQSRFDALPLEPGPVVEVIWDPTSDRPRAISPDVSSGPSCTEVAKNRYEQTLEHQVQLGGMGLTFKLPDLGELSLGQWMQWMIISSILENQLAQDT